MPTDIIMPQLGESVVEGTVSSWLKSIGEPIARFEPLLVVETDKVTTEIPSPAAGILHEIFVHEGETVAKGTRLAIIVQEGEIANTSSPPALQHNTQTHKAGASWHVTPVVARMAAEHHLDLNTIPGTGRAGRVTKKDVENYLAAASSQHPTASTAAPWETPGTGELFKPTEEYSDDIRNQDVQPPPRPAKEYESGELLPLTPMRRTIAERMMFSQQHSAHVTTVWEIDLTAVRAHQAAHREHAARQGIHLTLTAYFVAALVEALRAVPVLNGEWRDNGIYLHHQHHIGIAVALEDGLIVPVLKHADQMSLFGIARGVADLAERARRNQLSPEDVRGGTFTLSNHGVTGSLFATPIITPPQIGILGVGVMEERVRVINGMIAVRPCVYASLTFDHRAADGATADAMMAALRRTLESWRVET